MLDTFFQVRFTFTDLRQINLKTALQVAKDCKPLAKPPSLKHCELLLKTQVLSFAPRSIGVEIVDKFNIERVQREPIKYVPIINPRSILPLIDGEPKDEIGLPSLTHEEIQAARLIVIRRKKMKKHQRRKLWKRMRYRWARVCTIFYYIVNKLLCWNFANYNMLIIFTFYMCNSKVFIFKSCPLL